MFDLSMFEGKTKKATNSSGLDTSMFIKSDSIEPATPKVKPTVATAPQTSAPSYKRNIDYLSTIESAPVKSPTPLITGGGRSGAQNERSRYSVEDAREKSRQRFEENEQKRVEREAREKEFQSMLEQSRNLEGEPRTKTTGLLNRKVKIARTYDEYRNDTSNFVPPTKNDPEYDKYIESYKLSVAETPFRAGVAESLTGGIRKGLEYTFDKSGDSPLFEPTRQLTEAEQTAETYRPEQFKAGQVTGEIGKQAALYATVGNALRGTKFFENLGTKLGGEKVAQFTAGQIADLFVDAAIQTPQEILRKDTIEQIGFNRLIDVGFNLGIGAFAEYFKALKNADPQGFDKAVKELPADKAKTIQQELGLSADTTAESYLKEQEKLASNMAIEDYYKQFDTTPKQIVEDFNKWRADNFGGAFGKMAEGDEQALKELYKESTGIDLDVALKETAQTTPPLLRQVDQLTQSPQVAPLLNQADVASLAEQPVKQIDLSQTVSRNLTLSEGEKLRKTISNSLMRSELPSDMKQYFKDNPSTYKTITNEETWNNAIKNVANNFDDTLNNFKTKDALETASDTGEAIALLHQVSKTDIANANLLAQEFAEKATKSGQAIQAIVMLQKSTPEGKLVSAHNILKNATKKIEDELPSVYAKMKADGTLPKLSDDEAKFIIDNMTEAQNATGKERIKLISQVDQMLADKIPATMGDKIRALRNLSLLGNFKTTLSRNPLGNTIFSGLENVSQIPSGITDAMLSKVLKTQRQTPITPNLKAQAKGFKQGLSDVASDIKLNIDTSPTRGGIEIPRSRKIFEKSLATTLNELAGEPVKLAKFLEISWLNKANNWLGDALKLGDRPYYQAAYEMRLADLKKLGVNAPEKELEQLASDFALQRVFQNNGQTAKMVSNFKKSINQGVNLKEFGIDYGLGDIAMPYTQTPANILAKGLEYTPLNIINLGKIAAGGTADASAGLGKIGKNIAMNQKQFTDSVGRLFTGSGIIALGYAMAKNGHVTGKTQDTSGKVKDLKRDVGERNYSIKIGDTWYSYDWAQPAATPLAVGIDAYLSGEKEDEFIKRVEKGILSGADTIFKQSLFRGVTNMFGGQYGTPAEGISDTVLTAPTQFMSTLGGQIAQFGDKYQREVDYSSPIQQVSDTLKKKLPGVREKLPQKLNMLGQPKLEQEGKGKIQKAFDTFFNPSIVSNKTTNETLLEIERLFNETNNTGVIPSRMPNGLNKKEQYDFRKQFGTKINNVLYDTFNSKSYKNKSTFQQSEIVEKLISDTYKKAKIDFLADLEKTKKEQL